MDEISEYIRKARNAGSTDTQIKQALLNNGWQQAKIDTYFLSLTSSTKEHLPISPFVFSFGITTLCLIVLSGISFLVKSYVSSTGNKSSVSNNKTIASMKVGQDTQKVEKSKSAIIAFSQETISSPSAKRVVSEVKFYDLTTKKFLSPDPHIPALTNALYMLGKWSPLGTYLPILTIRASGEPLPFFLFDSQKNIVSKIYTFTENRESKYMGFSMSFWRENRWTDDTHLVFHSESMMQASPKKYILDIGGTITEKENERNYIIHNSEVTVVEDISSGSAKIKSILINKKIFPAEVKGQVIGVLKSELLSLELPTSPNINDFSKESEWNKKIDRATSEEEKQKVITEFFKPRGSSFLHFYDINSGVEKKSHEIKSEGSLVKNVQIRPVKKTILIALQEKTLPPYSMRFIELDPITMSYKTVAEVPNISSFPGLSLSNLDEYFNVSADGNWLLSYDGAVTELDSGISAWNLNNGEKIEICKKSCSWLRVYNPESLTQ